MALCRQCIQWFNSAGSTFRNLCAGNGFAVCLWWPWSEQHPWFITSKRTHFKIISIIFFIDKIAIVRFVSTLFHSRFIVSTKVRGKMSSVYHYEVDIFQLSGIMSYLKRFCIKIQKKLACGALKAMHHSFETFCYRFPMKIFFVVSNVHQSEVPNYLSTWMKRYPIKIYRNFWKNYQKNHTLDRCIDTVMQLAQSHWTAVVSLFPVEN